jgi:23S rRNA pseudoU1915 N3-methylase RlmH
MNITVYINSKRLDENIRQATDEYIKRLSAFCRLKIICQANAPVFDDSHNTCHFIITTAKSGKSKNNFAPDTITSVDFAKKINQLAVSGLSNIVYYIGYSRSDIGKAFF